MDASTTIELFEYSKYSCAANGVYPPPPPPPPRAQGLKQKDP